MKGVPNKSKFVWSSKIH